MWRSSSISGTSSVFSGERKEKEDAVFDALGDIDELSASLGWDNA